MFKAKKKLKDYRKWIDEIEKILDDENDNETKLRVIRNLIYIIRIHDLFDL